MRLFVFTVLLLGAAAGLRAADQSRPPTADEMALFRDAMKNSSQDTEHWAYTESTLIQASKGGTKGETVVRFDPSKPYAEQFTPLKIEGKLPSERQLKEYRKRGKRRGERVARAVEAARNPAFIAPPPKLRFGGNDVTLDIEHPLVAHQEGDRITFEVPVLSKRKDIPVEKFQVLMLVAKPVRLVQNVTLLLRESFRVKLVVKFKAGEAHMDFTVVDPKFAPVMTRMAGNIAVSLMFIPVDATFTHTRTDWQRVKSFDERLKVKLGPLQFPGF